MTKLRWILVLIVVALLGGTASAATYDPDLTWRTLVTEHFRIHFHQGEEQLADEFARRIEATYAEMSEEMDWRLRMKTDVVLVDRTDRANGFASAVPYNSITIYVTAPQEDATLSLYEDWSDAIFKHELTHVLHLETNGGIVAVTRALVGRIASTNDLSPWWVVEGLATLQETRHTAGGRGRSPYVDMIKRTAVVDDAFPPLGNLDGLQAQLPAGNLRYLFGQDFMQYTADVTGEDVWTRWTHAYGRSIPWILPARKVFGRQLQGLYRDWRDHLFTTYGEQIARIEAEGVREGVVISDPTASCQSPAFSPDDAVMVWSCYDIRTGNALWIAEADGSGARKLKQDFGAKTFTWRADGKAFVYAASHIVNRFNTWSDIYLFDLKTKKVKALTRGARARDPDFSPDGKELMVVTNRAQDNQLEVMTVDQRRTRLTDHTDHTQYSTPRYHPGGEVVAVSIWEHGRRDLWLVRPDGTRLRRLTHDIANDRDPAWSRDGRWLFFTSERSGVPNIYAVDMRDEHLWQVTHVRTGAARPAVSADDARLAYQQYSADGWEVRILPLDPEQWIDRGTLPAPLLGGEALAELVGGELVAPDASAVASWEGEPVKGRGGHGIDEQAPAVNGVDAWGPASGAPPTRVAGSGDAGGERGRRQDTDRVQTYELAEVDDAFGAEEDYPFVVEPRRYNPMIGLLPRYWIPTIQTTPRLPKPPSTGPFDFLSNLPAPFVVGGLVFRAATGASDPLRHYSYSANLSYRTDANFVGGGGSFTVNRWLPVFSVGASTSAVPYTYLVNRPDQEVDEDGNPVYTSDDLNTFFMRQVNAFASVSYPWTQRSTFFARYAFTERKALTPIDPDAEPTSVALRGTVGGLTAGYSYGWSQPTPTSISAEDGRSFTATATLYAPWLGTIAVDDDGTREGVTQLLLTADWREYIVNPLAPNHVFALRGGLGVAIGGRDRFLGNFQLGGNGIGAFRAIRGYPTGADRGDAYWLAGAEYRLPLWRMDRGFGTVPAFFRVLHGAVFAEAGNAFTTQSVQFVEVFDEALVGVGAELRLLAVLGWAVGVDLRLGYAIGLTQNGYGYDDPRAIYFQINGGF